jgi:hypothetical protein
LDQTRERYCKSRRAPTISLAGPDQSGPEYRFARPIEYPRADNLAVRDDVDEILARFYLHLAGLN